MKTDSPWMRQVVEALLSPCSFELFSGISSHPAVFFSHNKPANSTFSHNKLAKQTCCLFVRIVVPSASSVDAMIVAPLWCLVQTGTIGGARHHACYHRISPVIVQPSRLGVG
jgi:hypothetical protein